MAEIFDPVPLLAAVPRIAGGWSAGVSLFNGGWIAASTLTAHRDFALLSAHERLEISAREREAMEKLSAGCEALLPAALFPAEAFPSFRLHFFTHHPGHDGTDAAAPAKVSLALVFGRGAGSKLVPAVWTDLSARAERSRGILKAGRAWTGAPDDPWWVAGGVRVGGLKFREIVVRGADHGRAHKAAGIVGMFLQSLLQKDLSPSSVRVEWIHPLERKALDGRISDFLATLAAESRKETP